jgi:hypothetical protein
VVLESAPAHNLLVSERETSKWAEPWMMGLAFRCFEVFLAAELVDPLEIMAAKGLGAISLISGPTLELFLAPVATGVARAECGTCTPVLGTFWVAKLVGVLPGLAILDVFEDFGVLSDLEGLSDFRFGTVVLLDVTFMV